MSSAKSNAKYLIALVLGICSLWQVWDLCSKFLDRSTTIAIGHQQNDYLPLPKFLLCNKNRYNKEELSSMGLPENFLDSGKRFNKTEVFPDINTTWQRGTWQLQEMEIDWNFYEGFDASVRLIPVNTIFLGQCYLVNRTEHEVYSGKNTLKTSALMMNLLRNDSIINLYIIPSTEKSEVSAVVDRWNQPIDPIEIRSNNFLKLILEKEIHVKKSTVGYLCTDLQEENYAKCIIDGVTASYIDFPKPSCHNVSSPCWIPQADSVVKEHIIHDLPKCDTIEKYNCMVETIKKAPYDFVDKQCMRSCSVQSYKIALSRNNIEPVQKKGKLWNIYVMALYQSFTESVYKETEIYDFNAVVAGVGGSLGLFLGFSCYEYGKRLIDHFACVGHTKQVSHGIK